MSSVKWTAEEDHLLRLLRATNTIPEIENEFHRRHEKNIPGFTTLRSREAIRKYCEHHNITQENSVDHVSPVVDRWKNLQTIQDRYTSKSVDYTRGVNVEAEIKILALSDIHFPLARLDLLKNILEEHSNSDVVVLNGDILDGYIFSSFDKYERISALHEYQVAFDFIHMLSDTFPEVILTQGNHESRVSRSLRSSGYETEAIRVLRPDLLARIANGELLDHSGMLVKKFDFNNIKYDQVEPWYALVGKTLFIHPHSEGSAKPGYTVQKAYDTVFSRRYKFDEFDSVVCGHTHQICKFVHNNTLLIEQGSLAGVLSYAYSPKMKYTTLSSNGYAVIYQDKHGNTNYNLSNPIYCGILNPPKKERSR